VPIAGRAVCDAWCSSSIDDDWGVVYDDTISDVVRVVEAVGAAVMVVGSAAALLATIPAALDPARRPDAYQGLRRNLGRVILLGLEILIIGDIIRTIVVEPTIDDVVVLGIIVVIRIVLSFALEVEIYGRWPWSQPQPGAQPTDGQPSG
jgi:uncharacterized membrane protein